MKPIGKRFSLRTLMVVTSIICVLLGTWSVYVNPYRVQANALAAVKRLNGTYKLEPAKGPAWQQWLVTTMVGEDAFTQVKSVELPVGKLDRASLQSLAGLMYLQNLKLPRQALNDETAAMLRPMKALRSLNAPYAQVSDRTAPTLGNLSQLEELHLTGAPLSDAAIDELAKLEHLRTLYIRWTQISDEGCKRLSAALPNCEVYHHALAGD